MKVYNIMGKTKLWIGLSVTIVSLSIISVLVFGLRFGIDFTGGALLEATIPGATSESVRESLEAANFETKVQAESNNGYIIRFSPISEEQHQQVLQVLKDKYPDSKELQFTAVGPSVGAELARASIVAIIVLLLLIAAYIAFAFRKVSHPVASWKYGMVTLVAAFHDVIIPMGAFAAAGHFLGYQADTAFVAALLTILGYSINDTIVVLDRTRENLFRRRHEGSFANVVNHSIAETIARSLNTSFVILLPLVAIFIVGGATTRPFVFTIIVGIISGAYSSIFVASPLLVMWEKRKK